MAVSTEDEKEFRTAEAALWTSVGVAPAEEHITLGGGERVRVQVVGEGPPVLFIHGGSSSGVNYAPLVAGIQATSCSRSQATPPGSTNLSAAQI